MDKLVQEVLSAIQRCPLLGGSPYKVTLPQMHVFKVWLQVHHYNYDELNQYTVQVSSHDGFWGRLTTRRWTV